MARLSPDTNTKRRLFALSGNQCAFPGCLEEMVSETGSFVGEVCHIEAANPLGERYSEHQSDEDRRSFENLLLLCHKHHVETDDETAYPVPALQAMKATHEAQFEKRPYSLPPEVEERVLAAMEKKFKLLYAIAVDNNDRLKDVQQTLAEIKAIVSTQSAVALDESKVYDIKFEFIKELKKEGRYQTIVQKLVDLKTEGWAKMAIELKFKLLANLSGALYTLGRKQEGADYSLEIKKLGYETADSLAYLCLAYAIKDQKAEFDSCFERVMNLDGDNVNSWIAFITINSRYQAAEEIEKLIPTTIRDKQEILFTLGEAFLDQNKNETGFVLLEKSTTGTSTDNDNHRQVQGIIATKKILQIVAPEKVFLNRFSEQERNELISLCDELTQVWESVQNTELADSMWYLLMNRGVCYKILGEKVKAESDLFLAWQRSKSFIAFQNLAVQYLETNELDKAQLLLDEFDKSETVDGNEFDLVMIKARLLVAADRSEESADLLIAQLNKVDENTDEELRLLKIIFLTYANCGAFQKAQPYAQQIRDKFPEDPSGYLNLGICYHKLQDRESALENLDIAKQKAELAPPSLFSWTDLGDIYNDLDEYVKAADSFLKLFDITSYDHVYRRLMLAYFNSGEFEQAIKLAREAIDRHKQTSLPHEVLFRVYEATGETPKALQVVREHLQHGAPESSDHFRLLGAGLAQSIGDTATVLELLGQIKAPYWTHRSN